MALPEELKALPRWILWRYETRDDKQTKVPYSVTGQRAATTKPSTWASFAAVCAAADRVQANGIGFVFSGDDNIIGVDLDHVRDPETGKTVEWARDVLKALDNYTELSPSGTGFHVIMRGSKPEGSQCNLRFDLVTREGFEIYDAERYFTITGKHVAGTPLDVRTVSDAVISRVLTDMEARLPKKAAAMVARRDAVTVNLDDRELLRRMFASRDGATIADLYHGHGRYGSGSEADIALCGRLAFWTGKDSVQMDRLFRASVLMRDKWDVVHRADGATYGQMTIERALSGCRMAYSAQKPDDAAPRRATRR